jgi:NADH-quinone oxidoreductase subunit N
VLAGIPATAGFIGKFYLIDAAVDGEYAWLGVMIVVGSMLSLGYYLRVVATMWMGGVEVELPSGRKVRPVGGWSPEADARGAAGGHRRGARLRGRDDLLRHLSVAVV